MRAIQVSQYVSGPLDLKVSSVSDPTPAQDQYTIAVHATATNFFDLLQIRGKYQHQPPRPFVLGSELAGKISADSPIPDGCPFRRGDRVFGAAQGAYGEKVAAAWQALIPLPDNMTYDQGAGA